MIESRRPDLERIVENIEEASASIRDFADTIRRNPAKLLSDDEPRRLPETAD
jgi:hypothetical protein